MKRDLALDDDRGARHTSALSKRLAHTPEDDAAPAPAPRGKARRPTPTRTPPGRETGPTRTPAGRETGPGGPRKPADRSPAPAQAPAQAPTAPAPSIPDAPAPEDSERLSPGDTNGAEHVSAPDVAENEGMMPSQKPKVPPKSAKPRNRRHGRRR
jgi:hypothetical protein